MMRIVPPDRRQRTRREESEEKNVLSDNQEAIVRSGEFVVRWAVAALLLLRLASLPAWLPNGCMSSARIINIRAV